MKNILKKLHTIQTEIVKMEKDGYNDFQKYNYLSETQITLKMKQLLDKNGVVFAHNSRIESVIPFNNAKGAQNFLTNVIVDYAFYDIETGEDLRGTVSGQGTDAGDKGIYKAITGAIKYLFMKNFLIPTGDDPENEKSQAQAPAKQTTFTNTVQRLNNYKKPTAGDKCPKCGADMIYNPKTGKYFCKEKCWVNNG